ncbi:MAG TPA: hypothetical protein VJJ73_01695 [Candidatus Paceibacterota bacterium]
MNNGASAAYKYDEAIRLLKSLEEEQDEAISKFIKELEQKKINEIRARLNLSRG